MRLGLALFATCVLTSSVAPLRGQGPAIPPPPEEALDFGNAEQRITVPVSVVGQGPYHFIVDTGAERTVISSSLAGTLNLNRGPQIRITTLAGQALVDTVQIPSLRVSQFSRMALQAPELKAQDLGAVGMLGLDALQDHTVSIDFVRNTMLLLPGRKLAGKRRAVSDFDHDYGDLWRIGNGADNVIVRARNQFGQLILTDARYHGKRISAILDTGSPVTIGNNALLALMKRPPKPLGPIAIRSASGDMLAGDYRLVDMVQIGTIGFRNVPIAFADAAPFRHFDLQDRPAILLGMDMLRMFRSVRIDFPNREVRFFLPRNAIPPRSAL